MNQVAHTSFTSTHLSTLPFLTSNSVASAAQFPTGHLHAAQPSHKVLNSGSHFPNREFRRALQRPESTMRHQRARFSLSQLLTMEFTEPEYLVEGLIPQGLTMLAGAPKLGKSWMVLDLAYCVATGQPFLNHPVKQGTVLYLALEDNARRLAGRIKILAPELNNTESNVPLEFWTDCPRLDAGGMEVLEKWLAAAENPRAIIIDVLSHVAPQSSASRSEYEQISAYMRPLQALANNYGTSIVLVHHTKKSNGDSQGGDPFDQVLGSRALTSNMDTTMVLNRSRYQLDATLGITGRDIEEQELAVTKDELTQRWELSDRPQAPALPSERQKILDLITAGVTKTADIVAQSGKGRTAVQNLLTALKDDGYIYQVSKGLWALCNSRPTLEASKYTKETSDMNDDVTFDDLEDMI